MMVVYLKNGQVVKTDDILVSVSRKDADFKMVWRAFSSKIRSRHLEYVRAEEVVAVVSSATGCQEKDSTGSL